MRAFETTKPRQRRVRPYKIIDVQRLRTLVTGVLHTSMDHVYEDIKYFTGHSVFTHMIPVVIKTLNPYLEKHLTDRRFRSKSFDTTHTGRVRIPPLSLPQLTKFRLAIKKLCRATQITHEKYFIR